MRTAMLWAVLLATIPAGTALASDHDPGCISIDSCCESPARWADYHDMRDARFAIRTRDRSTVLLLTDDVVALQLSERMLRELRDEFREEEDEDDGILAHAIKVAVFGTVRELLRHSAECPVRDLSDVAYRHGQLVFVTEDGDRIFEDIHIHDRNVMTGFSESDARAFVRAFHRIKAARSR
jgi:hypothetical protein